jgi:aspartate/methionine/tyrosine aminotransferase
MPLEPFALERYFAEHEFSARYLLSSSDCQALSLKEVVRLADDECLSLWDNLTLSYTESPGHPMLRRAIAQLYGEMDEKDIQVVVPEEGIFLTMQAILTPGDHVISTFPGYQSLYEVARSLGCRVSLWKPDEAQGWKFNLDRLEGLMESTTRLVVINFPHNPTGATLEAKELGRLVDIVKRHNAYLFSDEMYRFLEIGSREPLPAACDLYEKAISLSGLSKSFGLPGLRLGWVATGNQKALERIRQLKDYTTICHSAPSEILGLIALRNRQTITRDHLARIEGNIDLLTAFMHRHEGRFSWQPPQGGSVCFPRLTTRQPASDFCRNLIAHTGIMLLPSSLFDYDDHHVRIGLGRDDLGKILDLLDNYLQTH